MSWFSRRKQVVEALGPSGLQTGSYRSPGLTRLTVELDRHPPDSILDLGASSTENVGFLSKYTSNLCIQDLFHSACDDPGQRATGFRFEDAEALQMPQPEDRFDLVLMWDLIHYFEDADRGTFVSRLAKHCLPDALVFLIASSSASIPMVPIQFKIEDRESLHYGVPEGGRTEPASLRTRQVENLLHDFEPLRCFQLRNGFQEFLFRYRGDAEAARA